MRTPADVIAQLARGPDILRAVVADVPPADLKRRPRPEKWSAHEHACHLALMEPLWAARAERILAEDVTISAEECWERYRLHAVAGWHMALFASMVVVQTDRGDEMFCVMANRHGRQMLDLDTESLL